MADTIRYIDDVSGNHVFPVTHERAVLDDDGIDIGAKTSQMGQTLADTVTTVEGITGTDEKTYEETDILDSEHFYLTGDALNGYFCYTSTGTDVGYKNASVGSIMTRDFVVSTGLLAAGYKSIVVETSSTYYTYITFLKKYKPSAEKTVSELFSDGYLCNIHTESGNPVIRLAHSQEIELDIPSDCKYIFFTKRNALVDAGDVDRKPSSIKPVLYTHTDGTLDEINEKIEPVDGLVESVDDLTNTVYGEYRDETETLDYSALRQEKISLDKTVVYNFGSQARDHRCYVIDVSGWKTVTITSGTSKSYFGIFKSKIPVSTTGIPESTISSTYKATGCTGYSPESGSTYRMVLTSGGTSAAITLSDNAKYLYVMRNYGDTSANYSPASIVLQRAVRKGGLVDGSGDDKVTGTSSDVLSLEFGTLDTDGKVIGSEDTLVSGFIPHGGGYFIGLKKGYHVDTAMLYDTSGNLLNNKYYARRSAFSNFYGNAKMLPQFMVRVTISADDESVITDKDVVKKYFAVNDRRFSRTIPTGAHYKQMLCRLNQLENVVWSNKENNAIIKYINSNYFYPATWVGAPYSEAAEYTRYLGMHVSFTTFLTAVMNKRSVLYTEQINNGNNVSKYGLSYHGLGDLSGTYYGTVCSGLTSYVHGDKNITMANSSDGSKLARGHRDSSTGETTIEVYENGAWRDGSIDEVFNLIEPLDFIWNTGHITIVSDVYKDVYGDKQFFVWSEENTPVAMSTPFTKEMFHNRLNYIVNSTSNGEYKEWAVYRKSDWDTRPSMPEEDTSNYIQNNFFDYPDSLSIDKDITTFAGEYAAFSIGDSSDTANNNKAFLNIHRGVVYDTLQIFAESADESVDEPLQSVDISSNSGTFIYNSSNIISTDAADGDDWIIVDLTQLPTALTQGKYKARVIKSDETGTESGFTHWQMIDITFSVQHTTGSGTIGTATFSSTGGTPYLIRQEKVDGMHNNSVELSASDISIGSKVISWSTSSTYKYIKLFVRGDYGVVVKRIEYSAD